jgi:hypothetical protein
LMGGCIKYSDNNSGTQMQQQGWQHGRNINYYFNYIVLRHTYNHHDGMKN